MNHAQPIIPSVSVLTFVGAAAFANPVHPGDAGWMGEGQDRGTLTADLSGLNSWGLHGDPLNSIMELDGSGYFFPLIVFIEYDLRFETYGGSLGSDIAIEISNSDNSFYNTIEPGTDKPGIFHTVGSRSTDIHLNEDGILRIEIAEFFDNLPGAADATFLEGSSITFHYFIPTPGTAGFFAAAGLLAMRRR